MIASMTGYATLSSEYASASLALELRSVNNRFLDLQFRLPDELRSLEPAMREILAASLTRGKVECRLTLSSQTGTMQNIHLNRAHLDMLQTLSQEVKSVFPAASDLSISDILQWPGIVNNNRITLNPGELHTPCLNLLQQTLPIFMATREREGDKLKTLLLERLHQVRQLVTALLPKLPIIFASFRSRLIQCIQAAGLPEMDERIRQEFTLFAHRIDVDEELSRLRTHLDEVENTLQQGGAVGKRLDFLMQELNREANTLASKSVDSAITQLAVEMKVLIEQMREQIQNIE
ncbi:MAG: YicC/YloC family endoribonuclease [Nitrosomonas sp.]|nr:YicC/YloC family endoribonuclease [Nitrosomonas sp.]